MYPLQTTTARIYACHELRDRAAESLGITEPSDEQISYERLLDTLGLDDALLFCRAEPEMAPIWRRYAVWCARQVQNLMTDQRSLSALDVAERHANGQATDEELAAAMAAAWAAADAAWAAAAAAKPAAWAAWAAAWAAADAADAADAARAAAAAKAAAGAAHAGAADDVWAAADAAKADARRHQSDAFRQLVTTGILP